MTVLIAGARAGADAVAEALADAGFDVSQTPEPEAKDTGDGELSVLAARLLDYERLLDESPAQALVVTDDSDDSLAAVLAATKVPIPVGFMERSDDEGVNGRLISRFADRTFGGDAGAAVSWLQDLLPN